MELGLVLAVDAASKKTADEIVSRHHSYVASTRVVGRCLKYLCLADGRPIGTLWIGSFFKPTPKDILNVLGMRQKHMDTLFNQFADNKKFCLMEHIPNAGTQYLRKMRERVSSDWRDKYGDDLVAVFTTVGGGKTGAVYRADNWETVGFTAGLPDSRSSVSMKWSSAAEISSRFVKPTGENKKLVLGTSRLAGSRLRLADLRQELGMDLL